MIFEPLDGIKLIMLMAAGLVFCLAGLYLLIRPKPEGNAAKIELFGLKFESSSAGLLVFLIGAAFLAVPMFVPEKAVTSGLSAPVPEPAPTASPASTPAPAAEATSTAQPTSAPILQAAAKIHETEPNNAIENANPLAIGQIAMGQTGRTGDGDVDWYVVPIPASGITGHEIKLKHFTKSGGIARAQVFNKREETVGHLNIANGVIYLPIKSQFDEVLYLRVTGSDSNEAGYEISIVPES